MKRLSIITLALASLLFAACSSKDPHDAPRDAKAYESVDPATLSSDALLAHLNLLVQETQLAVETKNAVEFHHLELALTPTLDAIAAKAGTKTPAVQPTLETLKALSLSLHQAGHDNNIGMAAKISQKFQELVPKIETALQ